MISYGLFRQRERYCNTTATIRFVRTVRTNRSQIIVNYTLRAVHELIAITHWCYFVVAMYIP